MENTESQKKTKDPNKTKNENQEHYRIVINKSVSEILETMLTKVTEGFDAGSVNKSDIANWIITNAESSFTETQVKAIQKLHFDERKILGALLRDSKDDNKLPESLRKAIREHYGLNEGSKRKNHDRRPGRPALT